MKKIVLFFSLLLSIASFAQKGAKMELFLEDQTLNYGKISKGNDDGLRTIEFKNTGDAPLIIMDVKSSCGCTVPSKPKEPILPGQTGKIDVKYNMNVGQIHKTITVESNAVNFAEGRVAIKITGEVIEKKETNLLEKKKVGPMN